MTVEDFYLPHASQADAIMYLLKRYPDGVSRTDLCAYQYRNKKGWVVGIGWEARNRISEMRKDLAECGLAIVCEKRGRMSYWKLVPMTESTGQRVFTLKG